MSFIDALVGQEEKNVPCKENKQILVQLDTCFQDLLVPVVTSLGWRSSRGKRAKLPIRSLPSRARVRAEMKRKRDLVDAELDTEDKKADQLLLKVRITKHELRYLNNLPKRSIPIS